MSTAAFASGIFVARSMGIGLFSKLKCINELNTLFCDETFVISRVDFASARSRAFVGFNDTCGS